MSEKSNVRIRIGTANDTPKVLGLVRELAVFENAPNEVTLTIDELIEDGFGANPIYGLFVAEEYSEIIGMALYYEKYSTWKGRSLFLEDIIVTESKRGLGIGHRLFKEVISVAKTKNSARMEWQVLDWNEPAITFYRQHNAELNGEWLNGKLTREQIQAY